MVQGFEELFPMLLEMMKDIQGDFHHLSTA
jgi:hypothetical protein